MKKGFGNSETSFKSFLGASSHLGRLGICIYTHCTMNSFKVLICGILGRIPPSPNMSFVYGDNEMRRKTADYCRETFLPVCFKGMPTNGLISLYLIDPCTVKKEKQIFLIFKEIQNGAVSKSYIRKGFLIYEEMRKYDFATAPL
jgi:hypothetical protein